MSRDILLLYFYFPEFIGLSVRCALQFVEDCMNDFLNTFCFLLVQVSLNTKSIFIENIFRFLRSDCYLVFFKKIYRFSELLDYLFVMYIFCKKFKKMTKIKGFTLYFFAVLT